MCLCVCVSYPTPVPQFVYLCACAFPPSPMCVCLCVLWGLDWVLEDSWVLSRGEPWLAFGGPRGQVGQSLVWAGAPLGGQAGLF